jgi:hypothetical protein
MSNKKMAAKQKELAKIQAERRKLIEPFLKNDDLIEGSYIELLQRCGRPECHCRKRPSHLVTRISKWTDGKLKHKVVQISDRNRVRKLVETYKRHKTSMAKLTKTVEMERKIMNEIIKLKNRRYE